MGVGIAVQAALHGFPTVVHDIDAARRDAVHARAQTILDELSAGGAFDRADAPQVLARLTTTDRLDEVAAADFVIEAIPEVLALKHSVYPQIEPHLREGAIFASNTSGFTPDRLAEALHDKSRFLIAHFWNPPHTIPLVEIVPGTATDPAVTQRTAALMSAIGMEPVVLTKAIPGFIGNRLQYALLREALNIVRSGAATPEVIDTVMKASLGRRYSVLGPLESADLGGLDTLTNVGSHLMPELATDLDVLDLMRVRAEAGDVGVRSGRGFYEWDDIRRQAAYAARLRLIRRATEPD
jgi:3-hydroxybutyryl-CoA dehydrogenase